MIMDTHHQNSNNDDNNSHNNEKKKKKKKTTKKNKSLKMISLEQVSPISIIRWICFLVVFGLVCQELIGIAVPPYSDINTTARNNNDFTFPTTSSTETTTTTNSYPQQQQLPLLPPLGKILPQEEDRIRFIHRHLPFIENDSRSSTITTNPTPTTATKTSTTPSTIPKTVKTTFVFFIGLEGTGHHYVGDMIRNSPMIQSLITPSTTSTTRTTSNSSSSSSSLKSSSSSSSILTSQDLLELSKSLFYHSFDKENPTTGLFNAHCVSSSSSKSSTKSKSKSKSDIGGVNITALEENVRNQMVSIHTKLQLHHNNNNQQQQSQQQSLHNHYYIPFNTLEEVSNSKWLGIGQLSYPNYGGKCRALNYPQLDILYNTICNKHSFKNSNVNIDCVHVYLYRNPYSIIKSTKRRNFYSTSLEGIQLYITQLLIIYTQLVRYSTRTIECLTVLDKTNEDTTTNNSSGRNFNDQLNVIKQMFYTMSAENDDDQIFFNKMLQNITHLPKQMTKQKQQHLISIEIQSYMNTMIQLHNDIIQLCQQSVIQNRKYVTQNYWYFNY